MYLLTPKGIKKYASPEEILCDYLEIRTSVYARRKAYMLKKLATEKATLELKARFIMDVIEDRLVVFRRERGDLEADMERRGYSKELLHTKTYEYTRDEVTKLRGRIQEYQRELSELEGSSVAELWEQNLRALSEK